jgi:hypothetical protein
VNAAIGYRPVCVGLSPWNQVMWVYARRIVTAMPKIKAGWYRADKDFIRNPMRKDVMSRDHHRPIAFIHDCSLPEPTIIGRHWGHASHVIPEGILRCCDARRQFTPDW